MRLAIKVAVVGAVLLLAALVWNPGLMQYIKPGPDPVKVVVVGHNWWWEFIYPEFGIKTANELHLPSGVEIQLELTSVDVVHTLSVPELSLQADAIPGGTTQLVLRLDAPGDFGGECSEVCGTAHNLMRVRVIAQTSTDFDKWIAGQQQPAALPHTEREQSGYDFLTTACAQCHSLNPAEPRTDLLGPNLAHLMSRSVFAGASFTLNETNLRRWLRDTQAMKAGNDMIVKLPRDDYEAVIDYLLLLR